MQSDETRNDRNDRDGSYHFGDSSQAAWNDHRRTDNSGYPSQYNNRNKKWNYNYSTQDVFLRRAIRTGEKQILTLKHNVTLTGSIISYDNWSLLIRSEGKERLIFKSAISDIMAG